MSKNMILRTFHFSWMCVCVCVLRHFRRVWLFSVLWTVAHQAPVSMATSGKNTGVGCRSLLQRTPDPGIEPESLTSPALAGRFFTTSATCDTSEYTDMCYRLGQASYCGSWSNNYCWEFFTLEIFFFLGIFLYIHKFLKGVSLELNRLNYGVWGSREQGVFVFI